MLMLHDCPSGRTVPQVVLEMKNGGTVLMLLIAMSAPSENGTFCSVNVSNAPPSSVVIVPKSSDPGMICSVGPDA
jgi:hypothetical protein